MKNKKGFTLTEILATIVILGIILAIAVPSYNALSKKFEKEYYDKLDKSVLAAAKSYWKDNPDKRPKEYLESGNITLSDLITNKYIDSVKEYRDKNDFPLSEKYKNGYALIIKDKDEYDYAVCLSGLKAVTSNSPEKEKYCDIAWLSNDHITKCDGESCPNAESSYLYYDPNYLNNEENQNKIKEALGYTPNYKKTNNAGTTTLKQIDLNGNKIYPENITSIDKKNIGIYKVEYPNEIYKEVEVFQYPTPNINIQDSTVNVSIPEDYKDSNGKEYFGRIIADADAEGKETNFKDFQISENDGKWVYCDSKGTSYEKTYNDVGEHKVKFRVVDNLGNVGAESDEQTVVVKAEEALAIIPKLENGNTYSGAWDSSNTSFTGDWTNQNVKFEIIANLGTNGKLKYSINSTEKGEIKLTDGKATIEVKVNKNASFTGTYKFWITGTELKKEATVKIDKIPPKLTVSTTTESGNKYIGSKKEKCGLFTTCTTDVWTKESIWLKSNPSDNESGIDNVSYKKGLGLIDYPLSYDQNYSDYIDDSYVKANITVVAYDKAGNSKEVSTKVNIDKISPYCSLSIDSSNDQIVYSSHDWEMLGIGLGSGVAKDTLPTGLTKEGCPSILNITDTCYAYKAGTFKGRAVDKAGNSYTCSITVPSKSTTTTEVTLSAPTITLNKTSTSSSPSTTDITFTLSNPNSVGKLQYKIGSGSWTNYSGSAVTLINTTGSKTVYARVTYNGKYSSVTDKTGYCNKDIATHERQTNGKDNTGCWIEFWMTHNSGISGNSGVTANRFQYAYWNAKETTDTKNKYWGTSSYNSMLSKECGSAPPKEVKIFDSYSANSGKNSKGQILTKKLYQRYSTQYYCFAIREYREKEISSVNRWKVWYKNAYTANDCNESGYTSQGYGK